MNPQYISKELFHFFGRSAPNDHERNYQLLKDVLSTGCISHPPHEVGWGTISYTLDLSKRIAHEEMLVPTVTCYCDIPFELLEPHLSKYGSFGLSFSRHHLTSVGARPVMYVPCRPDDWRGVFTGHTLLRELESTFRSIHEQKAEVLKEHVGEPEQVTVEGPAKTLLGALQKAEHTLALRMLAFVKPFESTLDDADPMYYYAEREWRKLGNLVFEPKDVVRVVVHSSYVERAMQNLPRFAKLIHAAPNANAG